MPRRCKPGPIVGKTSGPSSKLQTLNSKLQTKLQTFKIQTTRKYFLQGSVFGVLFGVFLIWKLEFVSSFEFRISSFLRLPFQRFNDHPILNQVAQVVDGDEFPCFLNIPYIHSNHPIYYLVVSIILINLCILGSQS